MEWQRATLVVITLLQLCRAEHIVPQWYSANINSGFQPKPISELFSSDPVFSTAKPIVVTQKYSNSISDEYDVFSSTLPPTSSSETTKMIQQTFAPTTTAIPAGALYQKVQLGQFHPLQQVDILPTTVSLPPRTSEFSTTRAFPITSFSTTPSPTTFLSTTPGSTIGTSTLSSSSVTVTPSSTLGLSSGCIKSTTPLPLLLNGLNKKAPALAFPLKIRVIAPTGSITNVNIIPLTTTKRPVTKSTTRRPTTRRTSKPKKNNYDRCLSGCRKVKDPICAAPLSHVAIDPKKLKGFPSVCHMACHNSYRKDPFEKVIDGSCSKLRTRIRLIDSKSKLKKDELLKNEYSVDQGQKTIIELSGLA